MIQHITNQFSSKEMAQHNSREFVRFKRNGNFAYYSYDDELYASCFPESWAQTHHPKTGPGNCSQCSNIGMWNGVFLGYCSNCAINIYKGTRGIGFICYGIETDFLGIMTQTQQNCKSIYDTQLKKIGLDNIGDPELYDTRLVHYPKTKFGEIPTLEQYTQYNVTYVSESSGEKEDDDILYYSDDEDDDEEKEEKESGSIITKEFEEKYYGYGYDCGGYGSNYNGGYDSY